MQVEIVITDDNGVEKARLKADAMHPAQFKTQPERPLTDGEYEMFAFTYQPTVRLATKAGGF